MLLYCCLLTFWARSKHDPLHVYRFVESFPRAKQPQKHTVYQSSAFWLATFPYACKMLRCSGTTKGKFRMVKQRKTILKQHLPKSPTIRHPNHGRPSFDLNTCCMSNGYFSNKQYLFEILTMVEIFTKQWYLYIYILNSLWIYSTISTYCTKDMI